MAFLLLHNHRETITPEKGTRKVGGATKQGVETVKQTAGDRLFSHQRSTQKNPQQKYCIDRIAGLEFFLGFFATGEGYWTES